MAKKLFAALEDLDCDDDGVLCMNVPLFIRLLEYAREDAKTDAALHVLTENITKLCEDGRVLTMAEYDMIIPGTVGEAAEATEGDKDEIIHRVVATVSDKDTATGLRKCLEEFAKKAAQGGDAEMFHSSGDTPESCGTVGHDVKIEHVDIWDTKK
jgi:hypothetical protein